MHEITDTENKIRDLVCQVKHDHDVLSSITWTRGARRHNKNFRQASTLFEPLIECSDSMSLSCPSWLVRPISFGLGDESLLRSTIADRIASLLWTKNDLRNAVETDVCSCKNPDWANWNSVHQGTTKFFSPHQPSSSIPRKRFLCCLELYL